MATEEGWPQVYKHLDSFTVLLLLFFSCLFMFGFCADHEPTHAAEIIYNILGVSACTPLAYILPKPVVQ